jgi:8-oxo-dGTP pyrophosphatase MutT (NUDIX family)
MELLEVYDINKNPLGKTIERGQKLGSGEYIRGVSIFIKNGIRYLIQLTSKEKGSVYALTGGCLSAGNDAMTQAVIECKEELGLDIEKENLTFLGSVLINDVIIDAHIYENPDRDLEEFPFELQKEEVENILWLSKDEIEDMILKGMIRKSTAQAYLQYVKDKY